MAYPQIHQEPYKGLPQILLLGNRGLHDRLRAAASDIETDFSAFTFAAPEPRRAVLLALLAGILAGSSADSRKLLARVLIGVLFDADS